MLLEPINGRDAAAGFAIGTYNNRNPYIPVPNPGSKFGRSDSIDELVVSAAEMGRLPTHSSSSLRRISHEGSYYDLMTLNQQQPTVPDMGLCQGHRLIL